MLRDYSFGAKREPGQPSAIEVFSRTTLGKTRFAVEPHKTTDTHYWRQLILDYTRRSLNGQGGASRTHEATQAERVKESCEARARRGSQRQLQDYVNLHPEVLTEAILDQLPPRMRELGARIEWVSPLAREGYREYRDADFLERVGLGRFREQLADFWPSRGPCWDALGVISGAVGLLRGVILLEAKSHVPEIYAGGCMAASGSLTKIQNSLQEAKGWCGATEESDWLGPLYQSANRIAHLYFLRERARTPAWLVNVYFTDDPIGPTNVEGWRSAIVNVKAKLGLKEFLKHAVEVFLPALGQDEPTPEPSHSNHLQRPNPSAETGTFDTWVGRWTNLASFEGTHLPEPDRRIRQVLDLLDEPIPGAWKREIDLQLHGARYRRGDLADPHPGEHSIEHAILCSGFPSVTCLGGRIIDGVNAMPLARDAYGGRRSNVEADLFLLIEKDGDYRLFLCEVKESANTPWYAAIENLRQLKLLHHNILARQLFHRRNPQLQLPAELPYSGLVIAPASYYARRGKCSNSVYPTRSLIEQVQRQTGLILEFAQWRPEANVVEHL